MTPTAHLNPYLLSSWNDLQEPQGALKVAEKGTGTPCLVHAHPLCRYYRIM